MNFHPENLAVLITSFDALATACLYIFFWCESGKMVTSAFAMFDHELWQCEWYSFPIETQRMVQFFMLVTQDPAVLCGYGNIICTRDTFKRVSVDFGRAILSPPIIA